MMRTALLAALLLASCGGEEGGPAPSADSRDPGLAGLYEGSGARGEGDRLCVIDGLRGAHNARFAFVTLGGAIADGRAACSGLGIAQREGEALRLTLGGEGDCAILARIEDGMIVFPAEVPPGCAYYCSKSASLAGRRFALAEAGTQAARRARDLVGDPLCP